MTLLTDSSLLNFLLQDTSSEVSSQNKVPPCLSHLKAYSDDGSKESSPNSSVEALTRKNKKNKKTKRHDIKKESLDGLENDDIIKLLESSSIFPTAKAKSNRPMSESHNTKKTSSLKDKREKDEQKYTKLRELMGKKKDEDEETNRKKDKKKKKKKKKEEEKRLSEGKQGKKDRGRNVQLEMDIHQEAVAGSVIGVSFSDATLISDEIYTRHADSLTALEAEEQLQDTDKLTQKEQELYGNHVEVEELKIHSKKTSVSTSLDDEAIENHTLKKDMVSQNKSRSNDWMKELIRQELEKNKITTSHKSKGKQRDLSSGLSSSKYSYEPQSSRKAHEKPKKEPNAEVDSRNASLERQERKKELKKDSIDKAGEKEDNENQPEMPSTEPSSKAQKRRKRGGKKHRKDTLMKGDSSNSKEVQT
ncbi:hypothetical protein KLMA_40366 [Kluyveromyces marxianus]|nr:hypothetical protein KLMA_40366 [Kluyveromyces marxianus]